MTFKEALNFRYACKQFNQDKKINNEDFNEILEAGRLAPSSFGLEHWDLIVIKNQKVKDDMKKVCLEQPQISTCSHLVVVLAKMDDLKPHSKYIQSSIENKVGKDLEKYTILSNIINGSLERNFKNNCDGLYGWSKAQCFLAAGNMMNMAAVLGIDSCALEGFVQEGVNKVLDINPNEHKIAVLLAFGYRDENETPRPKVRRKLDEFVKIIE